MEGGLELELLEARSFFMVPKLKLKDELLKKID
jgi:hypothetical protein